MRKTIIIATIVGCLYTVGGCKVDQSKPLTYAPAPTPTPTPIRTATPIPSPTPRPLPTSTPTIRPTPVPTVPPTPTPTPIPGQPTPTPTVPPPPGSSIVTLSPFYVVLNASITNAVPGLIVQIVGVSPDGTRGVGEGTIPVLAAGLNWNGTTYSFQTSLTSFPPKSVVTLNLMDSSRNIISSSNVTLP